jgi:hypothetical protein
MSVILQQDPAGYTLTVETFVVLQHLYEIIGFSRYYFIKTDFLVAICS